MQPGLLKGSIGITTVFVSVSASAVFILVMNLVFGAGGIILINQWHDSRGLAAGYYIHLFRSSLLHGLLRGTNSFLFPYSSQVDVVIGFFKVGLWETLALSLICAATATLASYPLNSSQGLVSFIKLVRQPTKYMNTKEIATVLLGIVMLIFSAIMEELNIVS